ncbi:MAG: ABC transporter permease [Myxococcales bacterium]|nr:MAG: ABC transporter permease [Myxococcales bacterium]
MVPPDARRGADGPLLVLRPFRVFSWRELGELWEYRELLGILAWRDVSVRYKQAGFGVAWALLQPALQTVIFTVLFHRIARLESDHGVPFAPFVLAGLAIWNVFSNGLSQASESLVRNGHLITKVYFPRLIIPLASLLVPLVDFAIALGLLVSVLVYYRQPVGPGLLLALPLALLATLAASGFGLLLAAINVEYRDVRHALPFFLQLLLYAAPVFYPSSAVPTRLRPLLDLNPMVPLIDAFRAALFGGPMPVGRLGLAVVEIAVVLVLGVWYFRRFERTFADRL